MDTDALGTRDRRDEETAGAGQTNRPDPDVVEIDTRYAAERWPYVCPRGHIEWRVTRTAFHCVACSRNGRAGRFDSLLERRSGARIKREQVRVTETQVAAGYRADAAD